MANDCIPIYEPGGTITAHCSGAVTGRRFVKLTADAQGGGFIGLDSDALGGNIVVGPCTATAERVLGVANRDAASGGKVGVLATPGLVLPCEGGAAISAGVEVMVDSVGRVITFAVAANRYSVGIALADCTGIGAIAVVKIHGHSHLGPAA